MRQIRRPAQQLPRQPITRIAPSPLFIVLQTRISRSSYKSGTIEAYMSALANQSFVKMNGIGNEIVVVDLRRAARADQRRPRRARRAPAARLRSADGALSAAHAPAPMPSCASTTTTDRRPAPAATACAASPSCCSHESGKDALTSKPEPACSTAGAAPTALFTVDMGAPRLPGTKFRWPRSSATRARSNCRSGRSTRRCCTRPRP